MAIKKIGQNTYRICAVVKVRGKQFKRVRERFIGSQKKAIDIYNNLHRQCVIMAKEHKEKDASRFKKFKQLIQEYIEKEHPSDVSSYNRILRDCGDYPVSAESLDNLILGGADKEGFPIQSYMRLLDTEHALRYHSSGQSGTLVEVNRFLSNGKKNKIYRALRNVCEYGVKRRALRFNPLPKGGYHKKEIPRSRILSEAEYEKIKTKMEELYPHYLPLFLYCSKNPCRIGDIRRLTRKNLFLDERQITYVSSKKKVRVVHVIYDELLPYFKNLPVESEYLFYRPLHRKNQDPEYRQIGDFRKVWSKVLSECGISDLTFRDLRHHALTELLQKNPEITISDAMICGGWSNRYSVEVYHNADAIRTGKKLTDILLKKGKKENGKEKEM